LIHFYKRFIMIELTSRAKKFVMIGGVSCSVLGGLVLWKDAIAGHRLENQKSSKEIQQKIEKKIFIVTGANSGIGLETVRELASKKGKVFMACRDLTKCEEERKKIVLDTKNKYVYCRKCDLSSIESIKEFVNQFQSQETKCDVLVNNAAVMKCRKMVTKEGIESQLGVNHMGHILLTHLLKPSLEKADTNGRVIFLMNLDYRKGDINFEDLNSDKNYDADVAFYQSQLANMLSVLHLAKQWRSENILVNAVYPGVCATNIKRHMGVDKSISGNIIAHPLLWLLTRTAARGAQTVLWAAIDKDVEEKTGKLFSNMKEIDIDDKALDEISGKKILAVSKFWMGLDSN